jgi:hypothetical protein
MDRQQATVAAIVEAAKSNFFFRFIQNSGAGDFPCCIFCQTITVCTKVCEDY